MELAVLRVPGVTHERRPHLARHAIVPRYRDYVRVADVVRPQQIDVVRGGRPGDGGKRFLWWKTAEPTLARPAHPRDAQAAGAGLPGPARRALPRAARP